MSNTGTIALEPSHAASDQEHAGGAPSPEDTARAMKIVAKSLVRDLLAQGHHASCLILLATELVEAATVEVQRAAHHSPPLDGAGFLASRR